MPDRALTEPHARANVCAMSDDVVAADRILEEALERTGARDPREYYRERLRELKRSNATGYGEAVEYYRNTLIPEVTSGARDPLDAWTRYGRRLAEALAPGRAVEVDTTGRAHPATERPPLDRLVLHMPEDKRSRALLVALPPQLSAAQKATYDVLIGGKRSS